MRLTNSIKSIAIGSFDGIHLGHQALIRHVEAVVVIERNCSLITAGYRRTRYIDKLCFFYHLEKIKSLTSEEFVDRLLEDFPKLETIVIGYDFRFGYKKEGDTKLLQQLFNGEVKIIKEVKHKNISVHSRSIKEFIKNGEIELANELLNRQYSIEGKIIRGQGLGRKKLVPTLNIKIENYILPKDGVYATLTKIDNSWAYSISFLGHRVTTDGSFAIETHILDRDIEVVRGDIELKFITFIRENIKFNSLDKLKNQINRDIKRAREKLIFIT
jgi:riboflavin kinase/FMN adenylyltransferase